VILLLQNLKLIMLILLIGSVVGLSRLPGERDRMVSSRRADSN